MGISAAIGLTKMIYCGGSAVGQCASPPLKCFHFHVCVYLRAEGRGGESRPAKERRRQKQERRRIHSDGKKNKREGKENTATLKNPGKAEQQCKFLLMKSLSKATKILNCHKSC